MHASSELYNPDNQRPSMYNCVCCLVLQSHWCAVFSAQGAAVAMLAMRDRVEAANPSLSHLAISMLTAYKRHPYCGGMSMMEGMSIVKDLGIQTNASCPTMWDKWFWGWGSAFCICNNIPPPCGRRRQRSYPRVHRRCSRSCY